MPSAYLVMDTKIHDSVLYEKYKQLAKPIIERFGGEYLVRGGPLHIDQSELWSPSRLVLIKFESVEVAKSFLSSEVYRPVKALRLSASEATISIVEGL